MQCYTYPIRRALHECPEVVIAYQSNRTSTGVERRVWRRVDHIAGRNTVCYEQEGSRSWLDVALRRTQYLDNLITCEREALCAVLNGRRAKLARLQADPHSTPWAIEHTEVVIADLEAKLAALKGVEPATLGAPSAYRTGDLNYGTL